MKKSNRKVSKSHNKKSMDVSNIGRGRPRKTFVAMYHSQISGDKNAIKIRIKKSNLTKQIPVCSLIKFSLFLHLMYYFFQLNLHKKKSGRRKKHKAGSDTDLSDCESSSKRNKLSIIKMSSVEEQPKEQSVWGQSVPYKVLHRVFHNLCVQEGCLPLLVT